MICKTANLRTLCLPALLFSRSPHSPPPPSLRTANLLSLSPLSLVTPVLSLARSFSLTCSCPLSLSLSISARFPLAPSISTHPVFLPRAFLNPRKHTHTYTNSDCHSLALSPSSPPPSSRPSPSSHSPAFPHPCGTSRKLYVPTLATLNAGLARDNPRPSPPPSTTADPLVHLVLPISAARRLPPFLSAPTVLPDSQPANQHASRLNPRST